MENEDLSRTSRAGAFPTPRLAPLNQLLVLYVVMAKGASDNNSAEGLHESHKTLTKGFTNLLCH
jgi:hypothetical protein